MNNVYNSDSNEIKFRRCGNDWQYCSGNCEKCRIPNYKASNTTSEMEITHHVSNTTSEERRCSDYNVVL